MNLYNAKGNELKGIDKLIALNKDYQSLKILHTKIEELDDMMYELPEELIKEKEHASLSKLKERIYKKITVLIDVAKKEIR
jgi:hypothetical protein